MPAPTLFAVHHVKLPLTDLARSRDRYTSVLGLQITREFEDDDGVIRGLAGMLTDPDVAARIRGFDPLALAVPDADALQTWSERVTALGQPRPTTSPNGTMLFLHDPDGLEIRLVGPPHRTAPEPRGRALDQAKPDGNDQRTAASQ
jgi:catechol 2,3-dioxygenase-like lactoylglutathione lyase family enzyme